MQAAAEIIRKRNKPAPKNKIKSVKEKVKQNALREEPAGRMFLVLRVKFRLSPKGLN